MLKSCHHLPSFQTNSRPSPISKSQIRKVSESFSSKHVIVGCGSVPIVGKWLEGLCSKRNWSIGNKEDHENLLPCVCYVWVYVYVCAPHRCKHPQRSEEDDGTHGTLAAGTCEQPDVGSGNGTPGPSAWTARGISPAWAGEVLLAHRKGVLFFFN